MQIAVTGADGLLGNNLTRLLLDEGHDVRALVQPGRPSLTLDDLPVERFEGDLASPDTLEPFVRDADAVLHCAASTRVWPARHPSLHAVNVRGTANLIEACLAAGVDRFIHVGSANSFAPGPKGAPGTEENSYDGARYGLDYMDSKKEGMDLVLAAVKERGLPALVVCPGFMIGPYDATPSSGTMLIRLARGQVPGASAGGKNYVYVGDVARAMVNALTMGRVGEAYIVGNENYTYKEFFDLACGVMGVQGPRFTFPATVVKTIGLLGSMGAAITRRPPILSYAMARMGCVEGFYSPAKARRELAMPATPLEQAVAESIGWLKENGYLEAHR